MDLFLCLQFPRSNAKSHSQTHIGSHLNLALRGLEVTQHQVHELVNVVKDQSQQIERQSQHIERLLSKDKEQSQQIEQQSEQIEQQSQQIERQLGQIERLMSKDKEQSETLERSISTVQGESPQEEPLGPINPIFPTTFEWEIEIPTHTAQNLFSKRFYLFERGYRYKMQIKSRLKPSTVDVGVYIKVVPGEFDELLSWPCKEKVRVAWVKKPPLHYICRSDVIDFEKGRRPCSRPLNKDHHPYSLVFDFNVGNFTLKDTILIKVNRE